ncbi:MAG: acyloxyacyl hydrolase [Bacteroidaceae bacterium]|nr:acyloxyacyl hydrolase [Bacteroidaceae bacterium]
MRFVIIIWCLLSSLTAYCQSVVTDTLVDDKAQTKHWGYETEFQAGRVLILDKYQKAYMISKSDYSAAFKFNHVSLPSDSDAFAYDYHYPTFSIVGKFSKNNGATMHRNEDYPHWDGMSDDYYELAPYNTHLGNSFAVFGSFSYPLYRGNHWEFDLCANLGLAYSASKYDKQTSVDNDMIGSKVLFYAGGAMNATYRFAPSWGIKAGLDYWHISNGSTRQPNRSANICGPTIGVIYYPYYETIYKERLTYTPPKFKPYWYLNFKGGIGMKTCMEDWERTQYQITKDHSDWRTEDFTLYSVASFQADAMYRYARIGAIGGGIDIQYNSCYAHIRNIDTEKGIDCQHNPWIIAVDAKHTLFYGNVSLALGGGVYLYKHLGDYSNRKDPFFFNRIGVHYTIPQLHNLTAGIEVKAHLTKADFAELVISWPIRLKAETISQ